MAFKNSLLNSNFKIYSASAGSGKTFTLAKAYIKLLIVSKNTEQFKHILAITFTNKAVAEMKTRIVSMLRLFSLPKSIKQPNPMFVDICNELEIKPEYLQQKSKQVLKHIIYNYAAFNVSTIDGFTHRVIRTFAFDLKLPLNFEVELDQDFVLNKAVDRLIAKAGTNKTLTKTLVDFAIEKTDDDKSWDISFDLNKIAKLLVSENSLGYLKTFNNKTLLDFENLKQDLLKRVEEKKASIQKKAKDTLTLIEEAGLQFDDFSGGYLPKHFKKLADLNFSVSFETKWQEDIATRVLYPKRVLDEVALIIEHIQPLLSDAFLTTKETLFQLKFLKAIYKNCTPLSVINAIQNELNLLKEEENTVLISEFNTIISNEVKAQPTPFIYERLGEKFRHYFVDEFQDTSKMQWENLIPLLDNSLASLEGSAMLVGDAKQAIYRWRGGEAHQFIDLYTKNKNPFQTEAQIVNLDTNYRSLKSIVEFNASFFDFIADTLFNNADYSSLYKDAKQKNNKPQDGYVNLSFLDIGKDDNRVQSYVEKTYSIVKQCLENKYTPSDICILVRKKKEGIAIANYLSQQGVSIVSSETLLLKNSPKVLLINNVLKLLINPEDNSLKVNLIIGLADVLQIEQKHLFIKTHLNLSGEQLFAAFQQFDINLDYNTLLQTPLFEMVETISRELTKTSINEPDAYLQFYLDFVFEYNQRHASGFAEFLEYFEKKQEQLSIALPNNLNAVKVMTIHKSKGLEFPIVIFPFADLNFYKEIDPKCWFSLNSEDFLGFEYALLNYSKDIQYFGEEGNEIYAQHQSKLELDGINLLYVVLTRPIEQLYIVSKRDINSKGEINNNTYSGLLIQYLKQCDLWDENKNEFSFGQIQRSINLENEKELDYTYNYISTPKESHNLKIITNSGYLWNTHQGQAIERGNLIHLVLSKIKTKADVKFALDEVIKSGQLKTSDRDEFKTMVDEIINHKIIKPYFSDAYTIYNEKDILMATGDFIRPDRINTKNNKATVIDYKTGAEDIAHKIQIDSYAKAIKEIGYTIDKKLLIYINETTTIVEV